MMEQRISLLTLGARDMGGLAGFYERLGWVREDSAEGVVAFDLPGQTLSLFPLEKLADDMGVPIETLGHGAIALAHNLRSPSEVDALMSRAAASGGRIVKPASAAFWGGYHGYFSDPEGHIWEVAYNPFAPLAADGSFRWRGYGEG